MLALDEPKQRPGDDQAERLQLAMEAARLGDWSWQTGDAHVSLSPRAAEIFGVGPGAKLTWADLREFIHEDDREAARQKVAQGLADREPYEVEYRFRRPRDGVEIWVLVRGQARYGGAGEAVSMVGVVADITAARAADAQLRESEARFREMADCAPGPVWVTSAAGPIEFVNQAFCEYAGKPFEGLLGDAWIGLLHPDDLPAVAARRAEARATSSPYVFEARFRRADGVWRWMQASSKPRFDAAGAFQGYVGMAVDVSEMREAEAALRESEERFRLIAENAPVMLWMGDEAGRCLYLNRELREFWGVPEDLGGFSWAQTLYPEDAEALFAAFGEAMAEQRAFQVEARYRRFDGEVRHLHTTAVPRRDAEGRFIGMIGVNVDVTDARMAEAHQKLLINELNHRVKNSLATVQSLAHQTLREGTPISTARELLTARLLALSAAHNVLTRENWEGADLAQIAREALKPFEAAGPSRMALTGPRVRLGPRAAVALSMALHELATNAVKYGALSAPAGRVALDWTVDGEALTLTWRESGGPKVEPPVRRGFGSRLLEAGLAMEIGGAAQLDFLPEGLVCTIEGWLEREF